MNIDQYLADRVDDQIKYYGSKSALNKKYYLNFKIAQLIAAALLPFTSAFISQSGNAKYIMAFLGTMVTILEGVLVVGKYHEKWITYRATNEALQKEKFLYLMNAGPYTGTEAMNNLVNNIETILAKENLNWQQLTNDKSAENKKTETAALHNPVKQNNKINNDYNNTQTNLQTMPIDPITGIKPDEEQISENR